MYLLDANAFMEASRLYYGFDIAPGFWTWLGDRKLTGQVASIEAVKDEITAGTGTLVTWAKALPAAFWLTDTEAVLAAMAQVTAWATSPGGRYRQAAIDVFLGSADLSLVSHAMAHDATVVTREQPAPGAQKTIKVPDACLAFGVPWTDPFSAYRLLGLRLVT